jgi:hypothetical protein
MNRFVSWGASTTWPEIYRALPSIESAWHGRAVTDGGDDIQQGLAEEEAAAEPEDEDSAR